ncbi:hypothetical protein ILYODFUR_007087 [Ilyodon furcidens]|uniref:Uncharacterized protein n=1 Tax=Ilyodon furcidens TaxID=33524 RepID=A0ABV0V109_9TELE
MATTEQGNGLELHDNTEKLTDSNGKGSSNGLDPGVNGSIPEESQVDKYGFTGGAQQSAGQLNYTAPKNKGNT